MTCEICNGTGASTEARLPNGTPFVAYCSCDAGRARLRKEWPKVEPSKEYLDALAAFEAES